MRVDIKKYTQFMRELTQASGWEYEAGENAEFQQGDIIYSTVHQNVGVVLGLVGQGECRTDSDGMQSMSKLRLATQEEITNSDYRSFRNYINNYGWEN
jgi:hypothetical protein